MSELITAAPQTAAGDAQTVADSISKSALWLAALRAFLREQIFVADAASARSAAAAANFKLKMRVAIWGLLQCSQSSVQLRPTENLDAAKIARWQQILHETAAAGEAIVSGRKIDSTAWTAWRNNLCATLDQTPTAVFLLEQHAANQRAASFPAPVARAFSSSRLSNLVRRELKFVVGHFFGLIEHLRFIETMLRLDQPLHPSLLLFALVQQETQDLLAQTNKLLKILPESNPLYDTLDGIGYVTPMELKKVFGRELIGLLETRQTPKVFASVENSVGLLKDSFQQAAVALATILDETIDAAQIFPEQEVKLRNSLQLRQELWVLLKFVQEAEKSREPKLLTALNRKLSDFRGNAMLFLMFKDFETTERFIAEIARTRRSEEIAQVLHRFGAYLETLLGQVNMRNVLTAHPFDYPKVEI